MPKRTSKRTNGDDRRRRLRPPPDPGAPRELVELAREVPDAEVPEVLPELLGVTARLIKKEGPENRSPSQLHHVVIASMLLNRYLFEVLGLPDNLDQPFS